MTVWLPTNTVLQELCIASSPGGTQTGIGGPPPGGGGPPSGDSTTAVYMPPPSGGGPSSGDSTFQLDSTPDRRFRYPTETLNEYNGVCTNDGTTSSTSTSSTSTSSTFTSPTSTALATTYSVSFGEGELGISLLEAKVEDAVRVTEISINSQAFSLGLIHPGDTLIRTYGYEISFRKSS